MLKRILTVLSIPFVVLSIVLFMLFMLCNRLAYMINPNIKNKLNAFENVVLKEMDKQMKDF